MKQLLDFMNEHNLIELEYEANGKRIKLRKNENRKGHTLINDLPISNVLEEPILHKPPEAVKKDENTIEFKSPMVGTLYRAPKPDAEPYVNVGDEITPDKVLCIIEAMKVMNEIKAEMNGVIKEILVKSGQAVEFGELLFLIQKKAES